MLAREYFQKMDDLNNKKKELTKQIKQINKDLWKMSNMIECPRCYQLFDQNEMSGQLCYICTDLIKQDFKKDTIK